jgi:hypothetical protein
MNEVSLMLTPNRHFRAYGLGDSGRCFESAKCNKRLLSRGSRILGRHKERPKFELLLVLKRAWLRETIERFWGFWAFMSILLGSRASVRWQYGMPFLLSKQ